MARRIEGIANPPLLIWARESAGFDNEEAAKKAHVKPEHLSQWEAGEGRPTLCQLRKLAWIYRRPLAVFHLPAPPQATYEPPRDFRVFVPADQREYSPALRLEVRQANHRRRLALQMYEEVGGPPEFGLEAHLREDAETVGLRIREDLGIDYADQRTWTGGYGREAFNNWRAAIEHAGVLVFQTRGVDEREMLGFSIEERPLPAIVINNQGAYTLRTFTMLHELTHIMLHVGGLCDLGESANERLQERPIEVFCNYVAGAALVPRSHLLQEEEVAEHRTGPVWLDDRVSSLARRYGVSPEALLRRLLICGRTTRDFYQRKRPEYLERYEQLRRRRTSKGAPHPSTLAVATVGPTLTRLVLRNYAEERITPTEAAGCLGVKLKHLDRIRAEVQFTPA
jgi:Zn-dependent peptidase ImmA (M78 family)